MRAAALILGLLATAGDAAAADNFFADLSVGETGYLAGDSDDRYFVSGDFFNASLEDESWSTGTAELIFHGGSAHVYELPAEDFGPSFRGLEQNFAWGTLRVESGQSLTLADGNASTGAAQYVRVLELEDGVAQIASITGNGFSIYYDPLRPENAYLDEMTFPLAGGGAVAPMDPVPVPAPSLSAWSPLALAAGLLLCGHVNGRAHAAACSFSAPARRDARRDRGSRG